MATVGHPVKKHDFMTPTDILEEKGVVGHAETLVTPTALVGTWVNCDKATRGMLKLVITPTGNNITLHGFGACTPTPCDWGTTTGMCYGLTVTDTNADAFTGKFKFNFKETNITGHIVSGVMIVETFDHFTDNSGRSDYYSRYFMAK